MKKQFLVILAAAAMLVAGCNSAQEKTSGSGSASGSQSGSGSQSDSGQTGANWSADVQKDMMTYLGEVLPYIAFDEASLYSQYSSNYEALGYGLYVIGDTNETNLFETVDYGALLVGAGFTLTTDEEYGDSYDKELADGGYLSVTFDYYEATDNYDAGHEIQVFCPIYVEPVTEESLIEQGYVKQTGWPTQLVADTLEGSGLTVPGVNSEGEWFVANDRYDDEEDGSYYLMAYLATKGDFVDTFVAGLPSELTYDETYDCYWDDTTEVEVDVALNNGFTMIEIYGPTLTDTPELVENENSFVKISSLEELVDGDYAIVCESQSVIFNGGLESLDATKNNLGINIESGAFGSSNLAELAMFTVTKTEEGYTFASQSGSYIYCDANSNALSEGTNPVSLEVTFETNGDVNIIGKAGARLRFNKSSGQERFRFYKTASYSNQEAIQLYKFVEAE